MSTEELNAIKAVQTQIDETEGLSLLQKDFLKLIYWSCENYGKYFYNKKTVEKKYEKIKEDFDIEKEIQTLIDSEIITMNTRKTIFRGEYKTIKQININKDVFNSLLNG